MTIYNPMDIAYRGLASRLIREAMKSVAGSNSMVNREKKERRDWIRLADLFWLVCDAPAYLDIMDMEVEFVYRWISEGCPADALLGRGEKPSNAESERQDTMKAGDGEIDEW